jgi:hypothetical protein
LIKREIRLLVERQELSATQFLHHFETLFGNEREDTDTLILNALSSVEKLEWSWKIYLPQEAIDWYKENRDPKALLAVPAVQRVRPVKSKTLREWARAVRNGDDVSKVIDEERLETYTLAEMLTDLSRRRFSGGDVKVRTQIAIASWMSRDNPSVFLRYMSYYVSKTTIGVESIGDDRPIVYTKSGSDTLWMVRLIVLINGWWLEQAKVFKGEVKMLEELILFIASDPFVNSARVKKCIAPFMQVISLDCEGDTFNWGSGKPHHYVRDAFSFDKAVVDAWSNKLKEASEKMIALGLSETNRFLNSVVHEYCSLESAYVASVLKYVSNVVGYGRTPLALAIDEQLADAASFYKEEGIPASDSIMDVSKEVVRRAIKKPSDGFQNPVAKTNWHRSVMPNVMTSNSAGGLKAKLNATVAGERKVITTSSKNQVMLQDPNRVMKTKLSLSEPPPEDLSDHAAMRAWFRRVKVTGDDFLCNGPWIIGIRQVPGNKPERMILMVPVEMMAYEGGITHLIYRYGMRTSYFTVSNQTGRVFSNDHTISLGTGRNLAPLVIVSTDFSGYDLTERDTHWGPYNSGLLQVLREEGIDKAFVLGLPLQDLVVIPQVLYSRISFGEQNPKIDETGHVRGSGMLITSGGVLSGEYGTMPKNSIIHEGIRRWIFDNLKDFDPKPIIEIISGFGWEISSYEVVEILHFWYGVYQETRTDVSDPEAIAHHGVMGDDGISRARLPDANYTRNHYLVLAAALEYGMNINGLSMNATKMTLSSSMCEYLKVLFIRGAVHPNIMQVLPQRERSSMTTDARLMCKSVAEYAALACSRGADSGFINDYFNLVMRLKWCVKVGWDKETRKSEYRDLPLSGLRNPDVGPGVVLGMLHLGPMPDVCRWVWPNLETEGLSTQLNSTSIAESMMDNFDKGRKYISSTLDRDRYRFSLEAHKRLGMGKGLGYYETPERTVLRAAKAGKTEALAWKASKTLPAKSAIPPINYDVRFEGEVEPSVSVESLPIGGISDDIREMLSYVGVGSTAYGRELGIVKFLRARDPGFIGDQDESAVTRLLMRVAEDQMLDALLYLGVSMEVASSVDVSEMIDCMLPDGLETRVLSSYYGFMDFSNPNLRRIVTFVNEGTSPVMTRWALLTGLTYFMTQKSTFRRVVITYRPDSFGYFT